MSAVSRPTWDTLLIANRGEIAARIARTAKALGLRTVAVFTDADAHSPHVTACDEAIRIGEGPVASSYLRIECLIDAVQQSGAHAIHPGYGFLSENAAFARAVQQCGRVWVGPPAAAIDAMGDKAAAKERMRAAGVPVVPGYDGDANDDETLVLECEKVGFPALIKASAGGGGRGMRVVTDVAGARDAIRSARAEAEAAFGSGRLLVERQVEGARHIEVQVFADQHGNVVYLGERDCTVQRRNQKVVEEAPSPVLSDDARARMGEAACAAARAVGYEGAGTVEFLWSPDGDFYFLEMNTRLQVEHPVTEAVTGFDLVEWQLRVAMGEPLPVTQADIALRGHAIEVRLYAEDPQQGYLPQPGPVACWSPSSLVRVDHNLPETGHISAYYDPMVAKVIATGPDRETARRRLLRALEDTVFFGVTTNRDLLTAILCHPDFVCGPIDTRWLDRNPQLAEHPAATAEADAVLLACWLSTEHTPTPDGFRTSHPTARRIDVDIDGRHLHANISATEAGWTVARDDRAWTLQLLPGTGPRRRIRINDRIHGVHLFRSSDRLWLRFRGHTSVVSAWNPAPKATADASSGAIRMPMAGTVLSVDVSVGDTVTRGQVVARVEAMKLETSLRASVDGVVTEVHAVAGRSATAGWVLLHIQPRPSEPDHTLAH